MSELSVILIIIFLGYALGRISIKGISLGTSGILLVALVFGHLGYSLPKVIGDLGLAFFLGAVGFKSGPAFIEDLKSNGLTFIALGATVITLGFGILYIFIIKFALPVPLALGLLSGALTSTPALGASLEATGGSDLVTVGYGIAYVFGVVGVIIFVQIMAQIFKDEKATKPIVEEKIEKTVEAEEIDSRGKFKLDRNNLSMFALAAFLGVLLGSIQVPLGNGLSFSLGTSGGPLLVGILFGILKKVGVFSLEVDEVLLSHIREIGLLLFLIRAGLSSGDGFVDVLLEYGFVLFAYGAVITVVPMIIGFFVARVIFKTNIKTSLGSLTGAMTSTPALGTLMEVFHGDVSVGASYAATYPMALLLLVLVPQFFVMFV